MPAAAPPADSRQLCHVTGQRDAYVAVDPAIADTSWRSTASGSPPAAESFDVKSVALVTPRGGTHQQVGRGHRHCEEVLDATVDLSLREGQQIDDVDTSREGLRGTGQRIESGRAGEDEPAGLQAPIQFGLDGVEHHGSLLELVDAHGRRTGCERPRIRPHRVTHRRLVEVDHLDPVPVGDLTQQC